MIAFFKNVSEWGRAGLMFLFAALLSFLSFVILYLEHGVFNFGDSDLPPYQPDTPFEKAFDAVWFTVTGGAGLSWLFAIIYVIALLYRAIKQRMAS